MSIAYCLETEALASTWRALYPEQSENIFSFPTLVALLAKATPPDETKRRALFDSWLPAETAESRERYYQTTLRLREALVLSKEAIGFLFSELPNSPKNRTLSRLQHHYIDSELDQDYARQTMNVSEAIRSQSLLASLPFKVKFIRGLRTSPLFEELAKVFPAEFSQGISESWPAGTLRATLSGGSQPLLNRLLKRLRGYLDRGVPPKQCVLLLSLNRREENYVRLLLAHYRIPTEVRRMPFQPIGEEGRLVLCYAGEDFLKFEKEPSVLMPDEIELLNRKGFAVWGESRFRERTLAYLQAAQANSRMSLLAAASPPLELRTRPFTVKKTPKPTAVPVSYATTSEVASLSATQLESFVRCPSQYFFSQRLKLRRYPLATLDNFAAPYGQAVHLALENYFTKQPAQVTVEALHAEFQKALNETVPATEENKLVRAILAEQFQTLVKKIPALERDLLTLFGKTQREQFELPFHIDLGPIKVRGKIDRIDRTGEGSVVILDYKTGNVDFTPEQIRRGENFQALLYCLALQKEDRDCVGILFYDLKKGEVRRGLIQAERLTKEATKAITRGHALAHDAYQALLRDGAEKLLAVAQAIALREFPPKPDVGFCGICDFPAHCRKGYLNG